VRPPLWKYCAQGAFVVAVVGAFRWMNPHPYASNSIYSLVAVLVAPLFFAVMRLDHEVRSIRARLEDLEKQHAPGSERVGRDKQRE